MTGERGMMVVMGHRLYVCFCVCGETSKNKALILLACRQIRKFTKDLLHSFSRIS